MTNPRPASLDRLQELLADRAVQALAPEEQAELQVLLPRLPAAEAESFDRAAAALDLALGPVRHEPLPAALRSRVEAQAGEYLAGRQAATPVIPIAERRAAAPSASRLGWWAAAAALLLAFLAWWPEITGSPSLSEQQTELMARADVYQEAWAATADSAAADAAGDVVWSGAEQKGFMRFRNLQANDPGQFQYQLWIFDKERDIRYPVDGGVFDIPAGADEVIVPIDPRIPVQDAFAFAVTIEKPGGVVVSERERIVLTAGL